MRFQDRN
ncbi:hypothetical protein SAMN02745223_00419 [Devosia limi DSM 17137]|nr:hypothetical protein SAMN02745223_00419 [Devosia limi DSM 17137]